MPNIFISGTDTGVGKTVISSGLVRLARKHGINCVGIKPVETGCPVKDGMLDPVDGRVLWEAGYRSFSLDDCAPYRFAMPASPFRAAAVEDSNLSVSDIVEHVLTVSEDTEMVVVEGAGGLMAPVEDQKMMIDVIQELQFPTILVARMTLGTINHTVLSVEALHKREIPIKGIVLCATQGISGPEEDYTAGDLSRILPEIPIVRFPFVKNATSNLDDIAEAMTLNWPGAFIKEIIGLQDYSPPR